MDWISFLLGVGVIIFVNIVYTIWVIPKQLKKTTEEANSLLELEEALNLMKAEHNESMKLWEERGNKLTASLKLRKSCPICGHEFPLYIVEEKVK